MTILHESIDLDRPAREVFAYVADFSTCEQWDSTATSATRLDSGPLGVGSRFKVVCALPVGSLPLEYEILSYEPDQKVVLRGRGRFFEVEDTILINSTDSGCTLDYTAVFEWGSLLKPIAARFEEGLQRMGGASVKIGLKQALDDNFPVPMLSRRNAKADRFLPSALSHFTRRGYRLGKKQWQPVSAWMGDKHVVLTGATAGLGLACATQLAAIGANLTLVVRDQTRGKALLEKLKASTGNDNIRLEIADLSLMTDVDRVIKSLISSKQAIDILINNAGAIFNPRGQTEEGLEQSFALLLAGPYRLTEGLYPLLKAAPAARVINVVSGGMYSQKLEVDDLQSESGKYSGSVAYARAKRALMIKTEQWASDWAEDGIVVNAMHPGWADTPGVKSSLPVFHALTRRFLRSPEEGADTICWLATATEADKLSGKLFLDREPRSTHLLRSTRETEADREALRLALLPWAP
jgi:dehydrogenase/reductase SDR family protein 12